MYIVTVLKGTFALNILFDLLLNFKGKCTVTGAYQECESIRGDALLVSVFEILKKNNKNITFFCLKFGSNKNVTYICIDNNN